MAHLLGQTLTTQGKWADQVEVEQVEPEQLIHLMLMAELQTKDHLAEQLVTETSAAVVIMVALILMEQVEAAQAHRVLMLYYLVAAA